MRVSRQQAAENRKRVLAVAGTLFREKGFDGIGVADLMKAAGLTHGGFYGQFGSKDDLAAEALGGALGQSVERWKMRSEANPEDPFGAIVGHYLSRTHCDGMAGGCAVSALGGDVVRQSDLVRKTYSDGIGALVDVLAATRDGDHADRRRQALAAMASIAGAVILARAVNDPSLSDEILEATRTSLGVGQGAAGRATPYR